jgi:hypothetical protein
MNQRVEQKENFQFSNVQISFSKNLNMTLKTFNLDEEVYKEFSKHCKENGISMSKKVENFIRKEVHLIKNPERKENKESGKVDSVDGHPLKRYC